MKLHPIFKGLQMQLTNETIKKAIDIAKSYGVKKLVLFGSALENISTARDLDLACEGLNDWKFFELAAKLEDELKVQIDLFPIDDSSFSRHITRIGQVLYERN